MPATVEQKSTALLVDESAVEKITGLMAKNPDADGLRIKVRGGGCSGLQYEFVMDNQHERDRAIEIDGARVLVDPKSLIYLRGSEFVYYKTLMVEEFRLQNPNVKSTCGCGTSFQV
jgi:iron-sulfur cluster assembly accessory protein